MILFPEINNSTNLNDSYTCDKLFMKCRILITSKIKVIKRVVIFYFA